MSTEKIDNQALEDLLAVTERTHRQDELCEKSHPENKQQGEDTSQVNKNIPQMCPHSTEAMNLPAIYDQQNCQPSSNIKPGALVKGSVVHLVEFYNKTP